MHTNNAAQTLALTLALATSSLACSGSPFSPEPSDVAPIAEETASQLSGLYEVDSFLQSGANCDELIESTIKRRFVLEREDSEQISLGLATCDGESECANGTQGVEMAQGSPQATGDLSLFFTESHAEHALRGGLYALVQPDEDHVCRDLVFEHQEITFHGTQVVITWAKLVRPPHSVEAGVAECPFDFQAAFDNLTESECQQAYVLTGHRVGAM